MFEKVDKEGRFILIRGKLFGNLITFLKVYAPSTSDWRFYRLFFNLILTEAKMILIIGGDLNIRFNPELGTTKPYLKQTNTQGKFLCCTVLKETGLIGIWRELNPFKNDYT